MKIRRWVLTDGLGPRWMIRCMAVVLLGLLMTDLPAEAGESAGDMDFKACIGLALRQSPFFTKSAMEIDIRRLDEWDSWSSFIPSVTLETRYYFLRPERVNYEQSPFYIQFSTGTYDPLRSFFNLKARKEFTRIANTVHLITISEGIYKLAKKFIDLETNDKLDACQDELVATARQKLTFVQKRYSMGEETALGVEIAAQRLAMAQAEKEQRLAAQKAVLDGMKYFFGLKPIQRLDINFLDAGRQVLGRFDPVHADLKQVKANSLELKIQKLKEELQDWNIILAYSKYVPVLTFGVKTSDLTSPESPSYEGQQQFYTYVGANLVLWDGFKRSRNVSRQKKILRQFKAETKMKETDLVITWLKAQNRLREAEMKLLRARSLEKLARLRVKQAEISYNSNSRPFSGLLDSRIDLLEAKKKALSENHSYEFVALDIYHLSGELFKSHVNVAPLKE